VALVTDAGTPAVSDPGVELVSLCASNGIRVIPVPGACAAVAAFSVSGFHAPFIFVGFLPPKSGARRNALQDFVDERRPIIFYEAPHRAAASLKDLADCLGPTRPVVVGRELTKVHEELFRGTLEEAADDISSRGSLKGEFTLVVGPPSKHSEEQSAVLNSEVLRTALIECKAKGMKTSEAVQHLLGTFPLRWKRREVYGAALYIWNKCEEDRTGDI